MIPKKIKFQSIKTDVVVMDGGLNENVSSLEMKGGELIACENYYITEGSTGGYVSLPGYEVYDGHPSPSLVAATEADHAARDAARALIDEVPGIGSVLATVVFKDKVYAFRNKAGGLVAGMFVESAAGWVEVDTSADPLTAGGHYTFIEYNFLATEDTKVLIWTNGVDQARMFDGTTLTTISNAGMGADDLPEFCGVWGDRLFLSYRGGSLQSSTSGDPTDFTTDPVELGIGYEITALKPLVGGSLVIFCDSAIKTLTGDSTLTSDWVLKTFTTTFGAYPYTVCDLFDTLIFMSDYGVTTLSAAQEYGDFAANSLSQKVKKTLLKYKSNISCAVVLQNINQYRLYLDNNRILIFSFINKKLRGITKGQYLTPVLTCSTGKNSSGNIVHFFTSSTGYVYKGDTGTSFNGSNIKTRLATAYYHYKSPRSWKAFNRLVFELASQSDLVAQVRTTFDYFDLQLPKTSEVPFSIQGLGDVYGEGIWGTFTYSGAELTTRNVYYFQAVASNMSVNFRTEGAYYKQHTIQNFIVDYTTVGRQQ